MQPQQAKETVLRHLDSYQKVRKMTVLSALIEQKLQSLWHNPVPIFSRTFLEKIHEAIQQNSNHSELPVYQLGYAMAISDFVEKVLQKIPALSETMVGEIPLFCQIALPILNV